MASPALDEKVALLERTLAEKQIPHAFGGVLADLGIDTGGEAGLGKIESDGQLRVRWEHTPIDLFFSYDALHASCMQRFEALLSSP